jgi:membrane-associated phospholipid phosphatase
MHSAGPIFAYIFDDQLGARFEPLHASLLQALGPDSRILHVHQGLALNALNTEVSPGGGISAMPSVHVAVTGVYVIAAWTHRYWRMVALAFAAVIWVGSVYFGYHYVTDGPVGFAIAAGCWFASKNLIHLLDPRNASWGLTVRGRAAA